MRALIVALCCLWAGLAAAAPMEREALAALVVPPYSLGERINDKGVHQLLNSGGAEAGFVFETEPLAPLPGFSGAPINVLVTLDLEGVFIDVRLISHNEPIFVSGLGEAPFRKFFEQYRGLSLASSLVVGTPYGEGEAGSALVYLDGVTKATASVRIAHESVLAAALAVAREKMGGVALGPPARPDPAVEEALDWNDLVEQGIATRRIVTNAELQEAFAGTVWFDDDPEALEDPEGVYLDLWIVDLGPPSVARAALAPETFRALQGFLAIADHDEPILVIDAGRHGLVSEDFVRNTAPDRLSAHQGGFPVALRDADLIVELAPGAPEGAAMILRTDRRLGFDPTAEWTLEAIAVREHGMFRPEIGTAAFAAVHAAPERFFIRPEAVQPAPAWAEALRGRAADMVALGAVLALLFGVMAGAMRRFAALPAFEPARLAALAAMTAFIGYWGQGQLSIVTPLAALAALNAGGSLEFLLYDPFSLLIWAAVIVSFVLWGRGLFCGWLCPFGALQEFAAKAGRLLRLPQIRPSPRWDRRLKSLKYVLLGGLVAVALLAPERIDLVAEVEPFKTAITVHFQREWWFVAYAVFWLGLSMVLFKGFCRYVCPLGALMAVGGLLRGRDWIARRVECGSPCQLCRVKCAYGAIRETGRIDYSECFQCLDCVKIHDDRAQCVPLVLAAKGRSLAPRPPRLTPAAAE